jgi:hypothetical protein
MEARTLNTAHINVAFIHERFDEERKSFTAGPKRWVTANMRPESFHELKAASNIGNNLRKYCSTSAWSMHESCWVGLPHDSINVNLGAIGLYHSFAALELRALQGIPLNRKNRSLGTPFSLNG